MWYYILLFSPPKRECCLGFEPQILFCPAFLSRVKVSKQNEEPVWENRVQTLYVCKAVFACRLVTSFFCFQKVTGEFCSFSSEFCFLTLQVLQSRVEMSIRPGPKLCCDLSMAPHEGRLATERGDNLFSTASLTKCTSVSITSIKTLIALVRFIH